MMLLRRGPSPPLHCSSFGRRHIHPAALVLAAKAAKITKVATTWGWMAASRGSPERAERFRTLTQRAAGALTLSLGGGGAYIAYQHSERVHVSGRTRLLLTTREEEIMMADIAVESIQSDLNPNKVLLTMDLDGVPPPPLKRRPFGLSHRQVDVMKHAVLTAAQRIVRAVRQSTDLPAGCEKLQWRLTVIDEPDTVNAFVLPNGHMFVYTARAACPSLAPASASPFRLLLRLLPLRAVSASAHRRLPSAAQGVLRDAPSQDCLAFLLGHECAHAALRHGGAPGGNCVHPCVSDDGASSVHLGPLRAQAAPTHPRAQPEHLGSLPWPQ